MQWGDTGRSGRLLNLADSHLSGNTYFDIVTNNTDGAEWTQVGEEIKLAVSASTAGQITDRLRKCISFRFWDTGVKVRENPCTTFEFSTDTGCTAHQSDGVYSPYHVFGWVTAPEGSIASINLGDSPGANTGTSWSSLRWCCIRWNEDGNESVQIGLRQGDNTFSFGSDLKPKKTDPVNYRFTYRFSDLLFAQLDGTFQWEDSFATMNYPGSDGHGDNNSLRTMTTDTPVSDGDHHIYAFVGIGRRDDGGDAKTIQGRYKIWVD
jgi:hypothetical protein